MYISSSSDERCDSHLIVLQGFKFATWNFLNGKAGIGSRAVEVIERTNQSSWYCPCQVVSVLDSKSSLTDSKTWGAQLSCNSRTSGPWFNIKMPSYQYRKSHCGDKTILRPAFLHYGISFTGKMSSLYWFCPLAEIKIVLSSTSADNCSVFKVLLQCRGLLRLIR